jgi:hypothetical protein
MKQFIKIAPFLFVIGWCMISCAPDKRIAYVGTPAKNVQITLIDEVKFDTVPGIVTYIDTAVTSPDWKGPGILWMKGFEVSTWDMVTTIPVCFLDENKRRIKYLGLGLIK